VNNWSNRNKGIVTDAWNKDNANRTERFKEYGQMEMARTKYNTKHPQRQVEQTEFVQKKQNRYQLLSADIPKKQAAQNESNTRTARGNNTEPVMKPTVTIPDRFKTKTNEQTNNNKTAENLQQHKTNVQKQNNTEKNNQIRNAQQYHQNMWQQSTPQRQPQQQENRQVQQPVRQNTQAPANNSNNSKRR